MTCNFCYIAGVKQRVFKDFNNFPQNISPLYYKVFLLLWLQCFWWKFYALIVGSSSNTRDIFVTFIQIHVVAFHSHYCRRFLQVRFAHLSYQIPGKSKKLSRNETRVRSCPFIEGRIPGHDPIPRRNCSTGTSRRSSHDVDHTLRPGRLEEPTVSENYRLSSLFYVSSQEHRHSIRSWHPPFEDSAD